MIQFSEKHVEKVARSMFLTSCNYYTSMAWELLSENRKTKWRNRARKALHEAFAEKEICHCATCGT